MKIFYIFSMDWILFSRKVAWTLILGHRNLKINIHFPNYPWSQMTYVKKKSETFLQTTHIAATLYPLEENTFRLINIKPSWFSQKPIIELPYSESPTNHCCLKNCYFVFPGCHKNNWWCCWTFWKADSKKTFGSGSRKFYRASVEKNFYNFHYPNSK